MLFPGVPFQTRLLLFMPIPASSILKAHPFSRVSIFILKRLSRRFFGLTCILQALHFILRLSSLWLMSGLDFDITQLSWDVGICFATGSPSTRRSLMPVLKCQAELEVFASSLYAKILRTLSSPVEFVKTPQSTVAA